MRHTHTHRHTYTHTHAHTHTHTHRYTGTQPHTHTHTQTHTHTNAYMCNARVASPPSSLFPSLFLRAFDAKRHMTFSEAVQAYLSLASRQNLYGIDLHAAELANGDACFVGISAQGIRVFNAHLGVS